MKEPECSPSRTLPWRSGKRSRILLGILIILLAVNVLDGLSSRFRGGDEDAGPPLDRCITEQAVLEFLDGKTILSSGLTHAARSGVETITLGKENISSLSIKSGDYGTILLRFSLNYESKQYPVECSFLFRTSDSPDLHYHSWDQFVGQLTSPR
jgi:hypothetical protein